MFSVKQKREIAEKVQKILRETNHVELPAGEINFTLHVEGAEPSWSWADICNNGSVENPGVNPWNEKQAKVPAKKSTEYILVVDDGNPVKEEIIRSIKESVR